MSALLRSPSAAVAAALLVPVLAFAAPDSVDAPSPTSSAQAPGWAFSATGMYYFPPIRTISCLSLPRPIAGRCI
jgi:hypothetical protein